MADIKGNQKEKLERYRKIVQPLLDEISVLYEKKKGSGSTENVCVCQYLAEWWTIERPSKDPLFLLLSPVTALRDIIREIFQNDKLSFAINIHTGVLEIFFPEKE